MSIHKNAKFLAKNLIFEKQQYLIGKSIKVNRKSLELDKKIRSEITRMCDYEMSLITNSYRRQAIKKYGFLDLNFALRNIDLGKCENPFQILRNEEFFFKDESADKDYIDTAIDFIDFTIEQNSEEILESKLFLKIFAESVGEFKSKFRHEKRAQTGIMKEISYQTNPFKVEFRITDACITNFRGIWSMKHFYW